MNGTESEVDAAAAPGDRRAHRKWPMWRVIVAYAVLMALALASIWFIDRRVDALAEDSPVGTSR